MLHLDDPAARARAAYDLWLQTYRITGNPRHLATARACLITALAEGGQQLSPQTVMTIRDRVLRITTRQRERLA